MDVAEPDPEVIQDTITSSPVDEAFNELDSICSRYEETVTLEIAEETYADLAQGVEQLYSVTCYTEHELEYYKQTLPGTVFSSLPSDYDAYDLTTDDATLHLKLETSHDARYSIDTPYEAVDITVPTTDAYLQQFYDTVTARQEEYDNDRATDSPGLDDIFE